MESFNMIINRVSMLVIFISCLMTIMTFNLAVSKPNINLHHQVPTMRVNPDIKEICNVADDSALCESSVIPYLNGHTNPASVLIMNIIAGIHTTEEAIRRAKHAIPSATPYEAERFKVCLETYESAMDSWKSAIKSIKAGHGFDVANDLSAVSSMISTCNDAFTNDDPTVPNTSPLAEIDELLMKMNSNCLAIRLKVFPK